MITTETILLVLSVLFFVSLLAGTAGSGFGVPALLLFLGVGMLAGILGIDFNNYKIAQAIGTVSLTVILFSGGMDTNVKEIRPVMWPGIVLATVGVVLTALFTGVLVWWLFKLGAGFGLVAEYELKICLLLAAVMASTDSASVFSILRSKGVALKNNLRPLLEFESGSNDPMAYMLTVSLISVINMHDKINYYDVAFSLCIQFAVGALAGYLLGRLTVLITNTIKNTDEAIYPILIFTGAIFVFSVTHFAHGNGFLAVYIAGLVIGNSGKDSKIEKGRAFAWIKQFLFPSKKKLLWYNKLKRKSIVYKSIFKFFALMDYKINQKIAYPIKRSIRKFFDGFAWMNQLLMFLTLGLLVNSSELIKLDVIIPGIIISALIILVARPLSVFISLHSFKKIGRKDKFFISWVGLRGAVPIIFAIMTLTAEIPEAKFIFNTVFFATLASLLFQGTSLIWVAKFMGVNSENTIEQKKLEQFGMDHDEDMGTVLSEIVLNKNILAKGETWEKLGMPKQARVVMIKRTEKEIAKEYMATKDGFLTSSEDTTMHQWRLPPVRPSKYIVPADETPLEQDDVLLVIAESEQVMKEVSEKMGIRKMPGEIGPPNTAAAEPAYR